MSFLTSSHKQRWTFTKEQLESLRKNRKGYDAQDDSNGHPSRASPPPGMLEGDEAAVLRFYQQRILNICATMQLPQKVQAAALVYFKRFYLYHSCVDQDYDALRICLAAIYVAGKVEECYISAESLCRIVGVEQSVVLKIEVTLLKGLNFDLIVHSPYRALQGLLQDIRIARGGNLGDLDSGSTPEPPPEAPKDLDPSLISASQASLEKLAGAARSSLDALMLSDVPLMAPPGMVALAALRSGAKTSGLSVSKYLSERVLRQAKTQRAEPGSADSLSAASLADSLAAIDGVMIAAGKLTVKDADARAADERIRKARAFRKASTPEVEGEDSVKVSRREAKVRARSEALSSQ